ncbi:SET domain-containing protein, partial [Phlegmacium glaucopus]
FGVVARNVLHKGIYLYELLGMMAADSEAMHSRLSEIFPHPTQKKGTDPRILFGPARFINHDCKLSNVEFVAIEGTSAFAILTTRQIRADEELYLNYGPDYFDDVVSGCPCQSCQATS